MGSTSMTDGLGPGNDDFLSSLVEENPLAIVVLDLQGLVTLCNRAFEELFLFPAAEILGQELDSLITCAETRQAAAELTRRTQTGESVRETTRRRRRDGSEIAVEIHSVSLRFDGEITGSFAVYQDITQRLDSERARRESEERFRRLAAATFEGLVVLEDEVIVDCNEQYARIAGGERDDLIGRSVFELTDPRDYDLVRERIRSGYESPYEHRARKLDGSMYYVEVHGKSIQQEDKQMRVTAIRDITEQRRFEDEARQSQKMEAIGRLAGGIAHDFNNLLTIILGHCSMLDRKVDSDSPFQGSLDEIRRAAEQAGLMTRRLLTFGRKGSVKPELLDLNHVLTGMQRMLRRLIRADIDLVINPSQSIGRVEADPGQLEQVILNLVINAGDAMPGGGTLTLETESLDLDDTWHREALAEIPPPWVLLSVEDTGIGMDSGTLERLFEPFFTTKKKGKGTGLGLSTVYGIVKQSGGNILVDSKPGHGTRFRIFFPEACASATEAPGKLVAGEPPLGSETILVVEDEPSVRRLAIDFLEIHGYRVMEAEDGLAGLELVRRSGSELQMILTDVVMPRMNGPDMAEHVALTHPGIRVLFMSGYEDGVLNRDDAMAKSQMVHKPFSMQELIGKVRETLDSPW